MVKMYKLKKWWTTTILEMTLLVRKQSRADGLHPEQYVRAVLRKLKKCEIVFGIVKHRDFFNRFTLEVKKTP